MKPLAQITPLLLLLAGCGGGAAAPDGGEKPDRPTATVAVATAVLGSQNDRVTAYGTTEAGPSADHAIVAPAEAVVARVAAPTSTAVAAGEPIVMLRPSPASRTAITKAASDVSVTDAAYARAQRLRRDGLVANTDVETAKAAAVTARATQANLGLSAGGTTLRAHLGTLFDPASRQFMVGPSIDLPIFQGGRLTGTLELRRSQQRDAALQFRKVVLQSWHDVDDAMVAYAEAQHTRVAAAGTRDADIRAVDAADQRYAQGLTSLPDVIAAQEGVLRGETAIAQAQADLALRLIDLYRALGGGWETLPPK